MYNIFSLFHFDVKFVNMSMISIWCTLYQYANIFKCHNFLPNMLFSSFPTERKEQVAAAAPGNLS